MEAISLIFFAFIASIIAAVPLGLVNISVMDSSYRNGSFSAMLVSSGAALVELAYGIIALTAGGLIAQLITNNRLLYYLVLAVPAVVGLFFLFKRSHNKAIHELNLKGFLKGIMLNLLSIQVFLYWLLAMTYMNVVLEISINFLTLVLFSLGIIFGKMGVLWLYAHFSKRIFDRMAFIARNVDRFIGIVLLISVFLQVLSGFEFGLNEIK